MDGLLAPWDEGWLQSDVTVQSVWCGASAACFPRKQEVLDQAASCLDIGAGQALSGLRMKLPWQLAGQLVSLYALVPHASCTSPASVQGCDTLMLPRVHCAASLHLKVCLNMQSHLPPLRPRRLR